MPTELHVLPGAPHGVQMFPDLPIAERWKQIVTEWVARTLEGSAVVRV